MGAPSARSRCGGWVPSPRAFLILAVPLLRHVLQHCGLRVRCLRLPQISLSSARVFRFGDFWDGVQTNLGAPVFDKQLPEGAHVLGFFGGGGGGGGGAGRLGIAYAVEEGAASPAKPYESALDAVSLSFLRQFYADHVKALDHTQGPLSTGAVGRHEHRNACDARRWRPPQGPHLPAQSGAAVCRADP